MSFTKTPYEIDLDLSKAKDNAQLEKKINGYVCAYKSFLIQNGKSLNIWPTQIEAATSEFKMWLYNSDERTNAMISEYKEFMGKK